MGKPDIDRSHCPEAHSPLPTAQLAASTTASAPLTSKPHPGNLQSSVTMFKTLPCLLLLSVICLHYVSLALLVCHCSFTL